MVLYEGILKVCRLHQMSLNSFLQITQAIFDCFLMRIPVLIPSPAIGDLYVVHSQLRMCAALKKPVLFQGRFINNKKINKK